MSSQRCSEPEGDRGPVVRYARVAAALVAVLASRAAVSNAGHTTRPHIATPWILVLVALGAGVILREAARGLTLRLPRPRWSARFVGTWAGISAPPMTVLLLASGGSPDPGAWISVALAVGVGLVLAASLLGARRLVWSLARLRRRTLARIRTCAVPIPYALMLAAPVPAPLLAGWSDRGPPPRLS